ncbi:MAG: hypothetical protein P9X22_01855 [Candidatus Zapsychrus exili]|nr:hypothetical protein [Candidatus Zapsychrus exili]
MKIVSTVFIIILIIASFVLAFHFNQKASSSNKGLEQERYLRMNAEQMLQETEEEVVSLKSEITSMKSKVERLERVAEQTKAFNEDLKLHLERVSKAKESLESKLQDLESIMDDSVEGNVSDTLKDGAKMP